MILLERRLIRKVVVRKSSNQNLRGMYALARRDKPTSTM
jgi:hypothetical protein